MPQFLKKFLNQITMYRLMLYFLLVLWASSIILSFTNSLPYNPVDILFSGIYFLIVCKVSNFLFAKLFKAKTNVESAYITALILTLIVSPSFSLQNLTILTFVGIVAMASKYVLAIRKKHIFNPAAVAVFLAAMVLNRGASWWIGSVYTLPIIFLGGLLVLAKIKRYRLVLGFVVTYFLTDFLFGGAITTNSFLIAPLWFFVFVMLVEPLTSPSTKNKQMFFGVFVALVYVLLPKVIPGYAYGLETALIMGNLFTLVISPSFNVILAFRKKEKIARNTWAFYFEPMSKFKFTPGQFMEWTYPHKNPDSRGTRRYFTISSAPEEENVMLTMRVAEDGSSFKSALMDIKKGEEIVASSPEGEFVLPKDKKTPLVFIAGGIGVTPFRSIVKHMLLKDIKRDIIHLYSNKVKEDIAFRELFEKAEDNGVKTHFINTEKDGHIDEEMIKDLVPDYKKRTFYVSGPKPMVEAFEKMLSGMGVEKIETDFFPGYKDTHQDS